MAGDRLETGRRLAVLKLAEDIGNVSEACRLSGVTRTQYYQYRRRWLAEGEAGLSPRRPVAGVSPHATGVSEREAISRIAERHPDATDAALAGMLRESGIRLSVVTLRKYLAASGLGNRTARWRHLDSIGFPLHTMTQEQIAFVEKWNPAFSLRERSIALPGKLLFQDCFSIGPASNASACFVHCAIDARTMYAFADLQRIKGPEAAVVLLHEEVFPEFERREVSVKAIVAGRSRVFTGKPSHLYGVFLKLFHVARYDARGVSGYGMGPVERFRRSLREGCFDGLPGKTSSQEFDALRNGLREWVAHFNASPLPGFPTFDASPRQVLDALCPAASAVDM